MKSDIVLCLKLNTEQWIRKLNEGSICFNRVGYFIEKAEGGVEDDQGDRFEGVFARLPQSDPRIDEYRNSLGDDLEIIDDNSHVFLRRKSVKRIPIFCIFGLKKEDLKCENEPVLCEDGQLHVKVKYFIPEKMNKRLLGAETCSEDIWGFYTSSDHFLSEVDRILDDNKLEYDKQIVSYDIDLNQEFELPLDDSYSELFHKRNDHDYQHEIRYILPTSPTDDKYVFTAKSLSGHSSGIAKGKVDYLEMNIIVEALNDTTV